MTHLPPSQHFLNLVTFLEVVLYLYFLAHCSLVLSAVAVFDDQISPSIPPAPPVNVLEYTSPQMHSAQSLEICVNQQYTTTKISLKMAIHNTHVLYF